MASSRPEAPSGRRDAGGALLRYAALLALFVAPAASRLLDEPISRDADRYYFLWSAWWVRSSLFEGANPYYTNLLYAPDGAPLVFHTLALLPSTLSAALATVLGPTIAYNAVALLAMLVAGMGGYAFCREITDNRNAAWLGGATFMLCPFTSGKLDQGWINLLWVGLLAIFAAKFVRATDERTAGSGGARAWLALTAAAIAITSEHLSVFAASVGVCVCVWRLASDPSAATVRRLIHAGWPSVAAVAPYLAIVAYYATRFDLSVPVRPAELTFIPEPLSYLLPLHANSIHASWVGTLGLPAVLSKQDLVCYLGLAAFPLAVAGLYRARSQPSVRFCIALSIAFLIVSLGPYLVHDREYVRLLGHRIPLPMGLLAPIPLLGAVAQSGRYMAIVYLGISAGVACFAASPPAALRRRLGRGLVPALLVLIALDYGFVVSPLPLPAAPRELPREGLVLARAGIFSLPLYFQTLDGRPLIAGPLSRPLPYALRRYRENPGLACWMSADDGAACNWDRFPEELERLAVSGAWLGARDRVRSEQLAANGFTPAFRYRNHVLWSRRLTPSGAAAEP